MDNFFEQVEYLLRTKSLGDLKAFVNRIAANVPTKEQQDFLAILEDKKVIIDKPLKPRKSVANTDFQRILERTKTLLSDVADYDIEAYYDDGGWDSDDGFIIKSDDGFANEFLYCYNAAVSLLAKGMYAESAEIFRLLFGVIDEFDEHNAEHEYGELHFGVLIENGLIDIDYKRAKALRGYSAIMSGEFSKELASIFALCDTNTNRLMFKEVLDAGSEPVPNVKTVLEQWVEVLNNAHPIKASPYIKEAAALLGDNAVMRRYVESYGKGEPTVYLDFCELLAEQNASVEKIIEIASRGVDSSQVDARKRNKLASLLANKAREINDNEMYSYAVLERFYSCVNLNSYIPVFELSAREINSSALAYLEKNISPHSNRNSDYYIIQLLNQKFDFVFDKIKNDKANLGWSNSAKGALFPFFLGLLVGFSEDALMIQKLIGDSVGKGDGSKIYALLRESIGLITKQQDENWRAWCAREVCERTDAIVSGTHRGSYFKAARLLVAICETRLYGKEPVATIESFAIIHEYRAKYPRHSAFQAELKSAINLAKLKVKL